ncbi:MAG: hypothetical protein ACRD03_04060 [Acidimicrobiales bacterium]
MPVALLAAAALGALVLAAPPRAAASGCEAADLLASFDVEAARVAYLELASADDVPACARDGIDRLTPLRAEVHRLLAAAQDAVSTQRTAEAVELVGQVRRLDPGNDAAKALLDDLAAGRTVPAPADPFAGARALLAAGYDDEAREAARAVAIEDKVPIPAELGAEEPSATVRVKDRTNDVSAWAGAAAIVAAVAGATLALVLKFIGWLRRKRFVTLGTFVVHDGEEGAGATLRTIVAEELAEAARSSKTFRVVDSAGVDLPELVEVPEQIRPVGQAIQLLFRRPVLTVGAAARPLGRGAWQVTAQITGRRRVVAQDTFRVPADAGPGLDRVGVWTAAWALYGLRANIGWQWRAHRTYPFGTARSASFAWLRLAAWRNVDPAIRLRRLHAALLEDHCNVAALCRLGMAQTADLDDVEEFRSGVEHLERAERALADRPTRLPRTLLGRPHRAKTRLEPLWFQIAYARTIAHLHRFSHGQSTVPSTAEADDLRVGTDCAVELAESIADTRLMLSGWWRRFTVSRARRRELRDMLNRDDRDHLGILAGACAAAARGRVDPVPSGSAGGRAFWKLAFRLAHDRDAAGLLGLVAEPLPEPHPRTLYNLACVWAQAGHPDKALENLRASFEHEVGDALVRHVAEAEEDPTLHPLRSDAACGEAFRSLIEDLRRRAPVRPPAATAAPVTADLWRVEVFDA